MWQAAQKGLTLIKLAVFKKVKDKKKLKTNKNRARAGKFFTFNGFLFCFVLAIKLNQYPISFFCANFSTSNLPGMEEPSSQSWINYNIQ